MGCAHTVGLNSPLILYVLYSFLFSNLNFALIVFFKFYILKVHNRTDTIEHDALPKGYITQDEAIKKLMRRKNAWMEN